MSTTDTAPNEAARRSARVLRERFRIPERWAGLPATEDSPSGRPGFFAIGDNHIGFGHLRSGSTSAEAADAPRVPTTSAGDPLPYDPDEVVDLLRTEAYIENALPDLNGTDAKALVRRAYYFVRPLLSTNVRKIAQRRALAGWDSIPQPQWPVDTTVEEIHRQALASAMVANGVTRVPVIWYWPEGYNGAVIMTHDVEEAAGLAFSPEMARLDQSFGFPSSFQIVPEVRYDIDGLVLDKIRDLDCEIGLHGLNHDGRLFSSYDVFSKRQPKIADYARRFDAVGFRSPVMYRNPEWISELDISYDMSFPNVGHLDPQLGGCCTVFPYFLGDVVELPTTCTQDYSLFNILNRFDLDLWITQLEIIEAEHGLANFIVHPDYVTDGKGLEAYKALLAELDRRCTEKNLWKAAPADLADWWRKRNNLELEEIDGEWRITGDGAERAQIAWATLEHDGTQVTISL